MHSEDFAVAVVNLRVSGEGLLPKPDLDSAGSAAAAATAGPVRERPVYFAGSWHDTPVHDSASLAEGVVIDGPAVVEYPETTLVLPPGSRGTADAARNVIITILDAAAGVRAIADPSLTTAGG